MIKMILSQSQIKLPTGYAEVSLKTGIGEHAPFWMISNKYGTESIDNNSMFIRTAIKTDLKTDKHFDYSYGIDLIGHYDKNTNASLEQLYVQGKVYMFTVLVGKKEEIFGGQDRLLSSGALLWSGNAPPFPIIAIYMENYMPVPFTKGYLEFKGGISHGWFGNNKYFKDIYLHHKYFYLQTGGNLPVHAHAGLNHFVQWGGTSAKPIIGKLPNDWNAFWKIFWGEHGDSSQHVPVGEIQNRLGNHVSGWDFGIDIKKENYTIGLYWQTMFEEVFGYHWANIRDGMWGISYNTLEKDRIINGFVYEFVHTTDQSLKRDRLKNGDNYFNHYIYKSGWSNGKYVIGTPLVTSRIFGLNDSLPNTANNRVIAHHIGISGLYKKISYTFFITYSLNYGISFHLFKNKKQNTSTLLRVTMPVNICSNCFLGFEQANDFGNLFKNNFSVRAFFQKQF
jgi:hypothetical protein